MRRFHLGLGTLLLVIFVLTGQYMHWVHDHLVGMPDAPRLLYRTRHIFILLAALLNLGMGAYVVLRAATGPRACQWLGSTLIAVAGGLFVAAFFYESASQDLRTPLSHWGTYTATAGVLLHVLASRSQSRAGS